jgi:hypothetical protein
MVILGKDFNVGFLNDSQKEVFDAIVGSFANESYAFIEYSGKTINDCWDINGIKYLLLYASSSRVYKDRSALECMGYVDTWMWAKFNTGDGAYTELGSIIYSGWVNDEMLADRFKNNWPIDLEN